MRAGCLAISGALAFGATAPPPAAEAITTAYYDGHEVALTIVASPQGFLLGPWRYGERVASVRPSDRRPNLYIVAPGTEHRDDRWPRFDHNTIVNRLPEAEQPAEWDVYWAIALDPRLRQGLRSERDLLLAAQAEFDPGDLYELEDAPGAALLRLAHVTTPAQLERFRRRDGKLPRLILLPAGFAVRARAAEISAAQ
jgi:hypothetical protein